MTFLPFEVDMALTLYDIDLQMTLTFKKVLVEHKHWIMQIMKFHSFNLDFIQMTLVFKFDLDIVKMYVWTENVVPSFKHYSQPTDRNTDRHTDFIETITYPHTRMVKSPFTISELLWILSRACLQKKHRLFCATNYQMIKPN